MISPVEGEVSKIGQTSGPLGARLSNLQTASWIELELFAAVGIHGVPVQAVEMAAHKIAAKRSKPLRGEWFAMASADALQTILDAADCMGAVARSVDQSWWHGITGMVERAELVEVGQEAERRRLLRIKLGID